MPPLNVLMVAEALALWRRIRRRRFKSVAGRNGGRMRIAQIAPLFESVPPRLYGGTERVVSYLTEELIRQGHQ